MCMESKRGGARPNAGRKAKNAAEKAVTVAFSCTPEQKEKLKKMIQAAGLSQSDFIKQKLFS